MPIKLQEITIAHSPDSDDAFMFYALAHNKLDTKGLKINQILKDIQSLNQDAIQGRYEVSAISFAAYPLVASRYALMPCGASIGDKYGPIVVASREFTVDDLKSATIAVPGKLTTAFMILSMVHPKLNVVERPFDQILKAVVDGKVDAGLIIHEGQLTYASMGLKKILDLGEWWFNETSLPLPLGGNVIRKDLGRQTIHEVTSLLKQSIEYSLEHREEALNYALTYAREMGRDLADKFVGMYVNNFTVDYGETGRKAVSKLFEIAYSRGVIPQSVQVEFID